MQPCQLPSSNDVSSSSHIKGWPST
uniref:Uncharacterized protein n=1 Tax=Triticum urartu TaxID=4572 RepID=A0A8R7QYS5_TRIUA